MTMDRPAQTHAGTAHEALGARNSSRIAATTSGPNESALGVIATMLSAFTARPIVELKQRDKSKIESILAYGRACLYRVFGPLG